MFGAAFAAADEIRALAEKEKQKYPKNRELQESLNAIIKQCEEISRASHDGWY